MVVYSKTEDQLLTLDPHDSRQAFEDEVQHRLHTDARTFLEEWKAGQLDLENPDVAFLLCLAPIYFPPPQDA